MEEFKNLLLYKGREFSATIHNMKTRGKIQVKYGHVYLCQNDISGKNLDNKLGYKYSWAVDKGSIQDLKNNGVTDFVLLNEKQLYKIGDWVWVKKVGCGGYDNGKHPVKITHINDDNTEFKYDLNSNSKLSFFVEGDISNWYMLSTIIRKAPSKIDEYKNPDKFKVGDRVKLNKLGLSQYQNQSHGKKGTIKKRHSRNIMNEWWWNVTWDNNRTNNYPTNTLVLVESIPDTNLHPSQPIQAMKQYSMVNVSVQKPSPFKIRKPNRINIYK